MKNTAMKMGVVATAAAMMFGCASGAGTTQNAGVAGKTLSEQVFNIGGMVLDAYTKNANRKTISVRSVNLLPFVHEGKNFTKIQLHATDGNVYQISAPTDKFEGDQLKNALKIKQVTMIGVSPADKPNHYNAMSWENLKF